MTQEDRLYFGSFCLETANPRLWHGERLVTLRRQSLSVLLYLVSRPGQVHAKEALLEQLWGGASVSSSALRVCIRELRRALGDQARVPQYIETVGYKGYRFCAVVRDTRQMRTCDPPPSTTCMFGREGELKHLQEAVNETRQGGVSWR